MMKRKRMEKGALAKEKIEERGERKKRKVMIDFPDLLNNPLNWDTTEVYSYLLDTDCKGICGKLKEQVS